MTYIHHSELDPGEIINIEVEKLFVIMAGRIGLGGNNNDDIGPGSRLKPRW